MLVDNAEALVAKFIPAPTPAQYDAALAKAQQPWRLNWAKLNSIADAAVEPLTQVFTQWATQPVQLRFIGAESLERVLKAATPSGERAVTTRPSPRRCTD